MSYTAYGEARKWYVKTTLLELSVEFRRRVEKLDRFYHAPDQAFEHDAPTQENSRSLPTNGFVGHSDVAGYRLK
jgi:hypothetical protein